MIDTDDRALKDDAFENYLIAHSSCWALQLEKEGFQVELVETADGDECWAPVGPPERLAEKRITSEGQADTFIRITRKRFEEEWTKDREGVLMLAEAVKRQRSKEDLMKTGRFTSYEKDVIKMMSEAGSTDTEIGVALNRDAQNVGQVRRRMGIAKYDCHQRHVGPTEG